MIRNTNTKKWDDVWFSELSPHAKLVFIFLCDNCDNAGVYEINRKFMVFLIGLSNQELDIAIKELDRKSYILSGNKKMLWLNNFLKWQKKIPLNYKNNNHKQIITLLEYYTSEDAKFKKCKEMRDLIPKKVVKKRKSSKPPSEFIKPTVEQVAEYMESKGVENAKLHAEKFWNWYETNGWVVGKAGHQMQKWRTAVNTWIVKWSKEYKVARPSKMDNIKEAHLEMEDINWNEVYKEQTV